MRKWLSVAIAVLALSLPAAPVSADPLVLAQESGGAEDAGGGEGQSDADAETGADEGQQEEGTAEEGPPWTYQMARITLVLVLLLFGMMALMYWRLVGRRARGA